MPGSELSEELLFCSFSSATFSAKVGSSLATSSIDSSISVNSSIDKSSINSRSSSSEDLPARRSRPKPKMRLRLSMAFLTGFAMCSSKKDSSLNSKSGTWSGYSTVIWVLPFQL